MAKPKRLILIDGMNLIHRSYYVNRNSKTVDGLHNSGAMGFIRYINRYVSKYKDEHIIVCLDEKGHTFRHEMYPEYKATRKATPEEINEQIPYIEKFMELSNIKYIKNVKYEADDLIGSIAREAKERQYKTLIITGDKDLLQLVDDSTFVEFFVKGGTQMYSEKTIAEEYSGLRPKRIIDLKALMGDKGDNIPGVAGIGNIKAINLLKTYGSLDNIYANIDELIGKTQESLIENKNIAYLSYELATIKCDVDMDYDFILQKGLINTQTPEVMELMDRLEIKKHNVGL